MKKHFLNSLAVTILLAVVNIATAQKVNINLRINEAEAATVFRDEAVLVDIAVFNKKAQADQRWNRTGEERLAELNEQLKKGSIKQEDYDREAASINKNKRVPPSTQLGSAAISWTTSVSWKVMNTANRNFIDLPLKLMKKPSADGPAVVDAAAYYIACYGISPDDMSSVPPGTYAVECFINNIPSNAVLLTVQPGRMEEAMASSEPVLLQMGKYYWHAGNGAKTIEYADKLLVKKSSSVEGLSLKGDGQLLQRSYLPALESYNKAIAEYYKQNGKDSEPPEYLYSMIDLIKKEMGQ